MKKVGWWDRQMHTERVEDKVQILDTQRSGSKSGWVAVQYFQYFRHC